MNGGDTFSADQLMMESSFIHWRWFIPLSLESGDTPSAEQRMTVSFFTRCGRCFSF